MKSIVNDTMLDMDKYLQDQNRLKHSAQNKKRLKEIEKVSEDSDPEERVPKILLDVSKSNVKVSKAVDDGDVTCYRRRLAKWKSNRPRDVEETFHELDGGLRVPNSVWDRLYRYQKTGVKWLWELHRMDSGGLLGDEMGLGKTVQAIAFFSGLANSGGLGPSLVVAPASVVHQWVAHFHDWWPPLRVAVLHQSGSYVGIDSKLINSIYDGNGILVTTYAGLVKHAKSLGQKKWHYIILDEGHKIRNSETQISKAVRVFKTSHRLIMTGSPLQNNLQELWSLFDFMAPGLLGTLTAFVENFAVPITQGGYANASPAQEALALSLATALKDTITPYILRRTKTEVQEHIKLPEKSEQVLFCSLTQEQKELYLRYLTSDTVRSILDKKSYFGDPLRARILVSLTTLRKICNHPDLYIYDVVDENEEFSDNQSFGYWRRAGKMIVINSLLRIWKKQGHRALIFTQSRAMMCILEQFLQVHHYKYLKMDGSTSIGSRQPLIKLFNENDEYLVFLATTRVGGLGVNLTGADRVIIYDPDWNPANDSQAKERAWRIGQRRDVTIYRLLSAGSIEEKIYQRQIFKQLLSNKVLLNPNQKNYLKTSTLQGLFTLEEPDAGGATETTNIFKHTKVGPEEKKNINDSILLSGGVCFSRDKMAAMRRLAQKISKNMTDETKPIEDPRERYKKKLMPPPPEPEKNPVNMINDEETDADFSTVLSEIDIVNMYSNSKTLTALESIEIDPKEDINIEKETEEEIIFEEITKEMDTKNECTEVPKEELLYEVVNETVVKNECLDVPDEEILFATKEMEIKKEFIAEDKGENKNDLSKCDSEISVPNLKDPVSSKRPSKRKSSKKHVEIIEGLKSSKILKDKPNLKEQPSENQDNYVLEKLFAKSGVKSALQHDKVIGLAEREERHKLRSESQAKALLALKALRKSRIKNWRW